MTKILNTTTLTFLQETTFIFYTIAFGWIIRAEKGNAYYLYIGQIKTSSSVDRSFVCCSESFDRHMEPHNSRFAKIMGARFAPPMGAMPHPTLCIELLGTIIVLSVCRCRAWVCCGGGGVCRLAGWVCLGETRVFVCLLSVLMSCVRSFSGWVRPAFSL